MYPLTFCDFCAKFSTRVQVILYKINVYANVHFFVTLQSTLKKSKKKRTINKTSCNNFIFFFSNTFGEINIRKLTNKSNKFAQDIRFLAAHSS